MEVQSKESNQYYSKVVEIDSEEFKTAEVEVIVTHEETKPLVVKFFNCKREKVEDCQLSEEEVKQDAYDFDKISVVR